MSSLKYIFVLEHNNLVRKVVDEAEKQSAEREDAIAVTESIAPLELPSEKPEPKPRNKRNKTSRG